MQTLRPAGPARGLHDVTRAGAIQPANLPCCLPGAALDAHSARGVLNAPPRCATVLSSLKLAPDRFLQRYEVVSRSGGASRCASRAGRQCRRLCLSRLPRDPEPPLYILHQLQVHAARMPPPTHSLAPQCQRPPAA